MMGLGIALTLPAIGVPTDPSPYRRAGPLRCPEYAGSGGSGTPGSVTVERAATGTVHELRGGHLVAALGALDRRVHQRPPLRPQAGRVRRHRGVPGQLADRLLRPVGLRVEVVPQPGAEPEVLR